MHCCNVLLPQGRLPQDLPDKEVIHLVVVTGTSKLLYLNQSVIFERNWLCPLIWLQLVRISEIMLCILQPYSGPTQGTPSAEEGSAPWSSMQCPLALCVLRLPWVEFNLWEAHHWLTPAVEPQLKWNIGAILKDLHGHRVTDTVKKDLIGTFGLWTLWI